MSEQLDFQASTKPYMIRAIHEWCVNTGLTPHVLVAVNTKTRVPLAYVKAGEIVLNLNYSATKDLLIDNNAISFSARFGGAAQNLFIPISAVRGIFARETGQGMFFEVDAQTDSLKTEIPVKADKNLDANYINSQITKKKPTLTIVK